MYLNQHPSIWYYRLVYTLTLWPSILELGRPETLVTYVLHDSMSQFSLGVMERLLTMTFICCCGLCCCSCHMSNVFLHVRFF